MQIAPFLSRQGSLLLIENVQCTETSCIDLSVRISYKIPEGRTFTYILHLSESTQYSQLPVFLSLMDVPDRVWPAHRGAAAGRGARRWARSATIKNVLIYQCSGSLTFWYRSRSANPHLWLTDPDQASDLDPDPAFHQWPSRDKQKIIFF